MASHLKKNLYPFGREAKGSKRPKRVADMIKNEIALLLLRKVKDPRMTNVSIVNAEMTKDLRRAIVYYSVLGDDEQVAKAAEGLERAKGFIRSHLARELGLRATPELVFKRDLSIEHQEKMERLLKEINIDADPPETGS
ncbi:MAG: 30S ribosome-binding factor RbfA [Deltaproteobacteria bacterium]|jgi:ribosome-binding factor A|nr:30S ribosome-binding factor RbfA [Deltaproteobacteria bacterium]